MSTTYPDRAGQYSVTVVRDFIARHYLIGGDWGPENELNSHHYRLELTLMGDRLDAHHYMVDIVEIEARLDSFVATYSESTLNDMPAFDGINPSIEWFCRVAWEELVPGLSAENVQRARVTIWEHETAAAHYEAPVSA